MKKAKSFHPLGFFNFIINVLSHQSQLKAPPV